jgi:broad specificity phosphatase PhoE
MGKILLLLIAGICLLGTVSGQTSTYILLRHAEKDTSTAGSTAMTADPPLAPKGALRAQNLLKVLEAYQPDAIYSTNYTRTKTTVTPLAKKFNKEIQLYDPKQLPVFAEQLLQIQGKTIVVVGHSNTTPVLVNLLIKETGKYPNLDDSDYSHLWIVTVTDGKGVAKMVAY